MPKTFGAQSRARIARTVKRVEQMPADRTGGDVPTIAPALCIAMFVVKSVSDDHLVCRSWDGENEGAADVLVAKPYLLRKTPFHGETIHGFEYTSSSASARDVERTSDSAFEPQVIAPAYQGVDGDYPGDVIYALHGILRGTGVVVDDAPVLWLDMNIDGRTWARSYIPE